MKHVAHVGVLVGRPDVMIQLGRLWHNLEDNIIMGLEV
jgi:hypothetical protein